MYKFKQDKRLPLLSVFAIVFLLIAGFFILMGDSEVKAGDDQQAGICRITFADDQISLSDESMAIVEGNKVIIGKNGNYWISGSSPNSAIVVETNDKDDVNIVFEDLEIISRDEPAFWVKKSEDVNIFLINRTRFENELSQEAIDEAIPTACFYSKSDVKIMGDGYLELKSDGDGMSVRGDLEIDSGNISINSGGDGIDAKSSVYFSGGIIDIFSIKDGINVKDNDSYMKGSFMMDGGRVVIDAQDEGIQAAESIAVDGGTINITSAGESIKSDGLISIADNCVFTN